MCSIRSLSDINNKHYPERGAVKHQICTQVSEIFSQWQEDKCVSLCCSVLPLLCDEFLFRVLSVCQPSVCFKGRNVCLCLSLLFLKLLICFSHVYRGDSTCSTTQPKHTLNTCTIKTIIELSNRTQSEKEHFLYKI